MQKRDAKVFPDHGIGCLFHLYHCCNTEACSNTSPVLSDRWGTILCKVVASEQDSCTLLVSIDQLVQALTYVFEGSLDPSSLVSASAVVLLKKLQLKCRSVDQTSKTKAWTDYFFFL